MMKGRFIVFEGIDGSGKGAQTRLLSGWLKDKGYTVFITKEPTEGKIGKLLREALKSGNVKPEPLALLFAADRLEHCFLIKRKLSEGKIVVSDRYLYSSIAYQGAQGIEKKWIEGINKFALIPDSIIYLDLDPEIGLERISSKESFRSLQKEKEYLEKKDFLEKVRKKYLEQSDTIPLFYTIDAKMPIKEVQTSVRKIIGRILKVKSTNNNAELTDFIK